MPSPSIAGSPARRARKRAAATAGEVLARRLTMVVELAESEIRIAEAAVARMPAETPADRGANR